MIDLGKDTTGEGAGKAARRLGGQDIIVGLTTKMRKSTISDKNGDVLKLFNGHSKQLYLGDVLQLFR
ncbi:MAG: hypothetical protein A2Z40_01115 [Deltaproteobacteria bacterium RBG_19FT_COMBO_60_16]|nr:MAG: hypothetical protein A2Z40_01115 [Deltaproteobacteria bacterium RBG_19FT_COMBO_60_16]